MGFVDTFKHSEFIINNITWVKRFLYRGSLITEKKLNVRS